MKSGIEQIAEERAKQLKKWGLEGDQKHVNNELPSEATALLNDLPDAWGLAAKHPDKVERLTIAGAIIAAEIDRLQF